VGHAHADGDAHRDTYAGLDTDPHGVRHRDAHRHGDCQRRHADRNTADAYAHRLGHRDVDADRHGDTHTGDSRPRHRDPHRHIDADVEPDDRAERDPHRHVDADPEPAGHGDAHAFAHLRTVADAHGDRDADGERHAYQRADEDPDDDAHVHRDAQLHAHRHGAAADPYGLGDPPALATAYLAAALNPANGDWNAHAVGHGHGDTHGHHHPQPDTVGHDNTDVSDHRPDYHLHGRGTCGWERRAADRYVAGRHQCLSARGRLRLLPGRRGQG